MIGELWSNKLRSSLSLLGIIIGIFCIIAVLTAVSSLEKTIVSNIQSLGNDVVYVQKWPWSAGGGEYPWWQYWRRPNVSEEEKELIEKKALSAESATLVAQLGGERMNFEDKVVEDITCKGVSHNYSEIHDIKFTSGRYFSQSECHIGTSVIIIGSDIAEALFPGIEPIGKVIKFSGQKLTVIGVAQKEGEDIFGMSLDQVGLVPYRYMAKIADVEGDQTSPFIAVKLREGNDKKAFKEELRGILRSARKLHPKEADNFALNEISIISDGLESVFGILTIAGFLIGGFAIVVGGFGIANIMFVSVKERTKFIGIRRALGAYRSEILMEFLTESVILCFLGGVIGLLMVWGVAYAANNFLLPEDSALFFILDINNIIVGLSISVMAGLVFGIVPALRAARLIPVEAIRS